MRIEAYFRQIQMQLDASPLIISSTVNYDQRGSFLGFMRGDLILVDGSTLHFREFVDTESTIDRDTYTYQYMDTNGQLVFRYDNTDHHQHLNLPTHPHHKHAGSEQHIIASSAPTLADVLVEVEQLVRW